MSTTVEIQTEIGKLEANILRSGNGIALVSYSDRLNDRYLPTIVRYSVTHLQSGYAFGGTVWRKTLSGDPLFLAKRLYDKIQELTAELGIDWQVTNFKLEEMPAHQKDAILTLVRREQFYWGAGHEMGDRQREILKESGFWLQEDGETCNTTETDVEYDRGFRINYMAPNEGVIMVDIQAGDEIWTRDLEDLPDWDYTFESASKFCKGVIDRLVDAV